MAAGTNDKHRRPEVVTDILVVGGGPAGCAVAIGLRRLGYEVTLLHSPRPGPTCEGISARTLQGLRNAGLEQAASLVSAASPRHAQWNGERSQANTEHLVLREGFDLALLEDARHAGVTTVPGRLRQIRDAAEDDLLVDLQVSGTEPSGVRCNFLVEARGRAAPAAPGDDLRGPETVSVLQTGEAGAAANGSLVSAFENGWLWRAVTATGRSFIQLTVDATSTQLPKKANLDAWFKLQLAHLDATADLAQNVPTPGPIIARGSTSLLRNQLLEGRIIRVGDAAMAVDPLSGNGIFQALSSALIAPAVINTVLREPANRALAAGFYRQRVRHTFFRFARTGRDFYRMESRWNDSAFWRDRQHWPDDQAAESTLPPTLLGLEWQPVLDHGLIVSRQVAVTSKQPLGVWHVAGIELAPLLHTLPVSPRERETELLARVDQRLGSDDHRKRLLAAWLQQHGQLPAND